MNTIITKKVTLLPSSFVGTRIGIDIQEGTDNLKFGIRSAALADGSSFATVAWGDGSVEEVRSLSGLFHEYAQPGAYEIRISDDIETLAFSSSTTTSDCFIADTPKIRTFATNASKLRRILAHCFLGCRHLEKCEFNAPELTTIGTSFCKDCTALAGNVYLMSASSITGAGSSYPFANCPLLNEIHFSASHKDELTRCGIFADWEQTHLGAANAVIKFDL